MPPVIQRTRSVIRRVADRWSSGPGGSLGVSGAGTCPGIDPGRQAAETARALPIIDEEQINMTLFQRAHDMSRPRPTKRSTPPRSLTRCSICPTSRCLTRSPRSVADWCRRRIAQADRAPGAAVPALGGPSQRPGQGSTGARQGVWRGRPSPARRLPRPRSTPWSLSMSSSPEQEGTRAPPWTCCRSG